MRKILFGRILPLAAMTGAMFASLTLYKLVARPEGFLTASSPGGSYRVELTGRQFRPRLPGVNNEVRFNVWEGGRTLLSDRRLFSGDWFDPSFEILYPRHTWVKENVLTFHGDDSTGDVSDQLIVQNKTDRKVAYLKVTADRLFLLFDLPPGYSATLPIPPPRGDLRWLEAEGQYSGGQVIAKRGVDFSIPRGTKRPLTFYVVIGDDQLMIDSGELEKYKAP